MTCFWVVVEEGLRASEAPRDVIRTMRTLGTMVAWVVCPCEGLVPWEASVGGWVPARALLGAVV